MDVGLSVHEGDKDQVVEVEQSNGNLPRNSLSEMNPMKII